MKETGARVLIPTKPVVCFGRLATHDGRAANEVVLTGPDAGATRLISRWHVELEASGDHWVLRALSDHGTRGGRRGRDARGTRGHPHRLDRRHRRHAHLTFVGGERAEDFEQPTLEGRER